MFEAVVDWLLNWLPDALASTTLTAFLILAPLGIFKWTRPFAGASLIFASYFFGITLWFWGAVATFEYWGWPGLIVGVVLLGVGVVPTGLIALALHSQWEAIFNWGMLMMSLIVARLLGAWYLAKCENVNDDTNG